MTSTLPLDKTNHAKRRAEDESLSANQARKKVLHDAFQVFDLQTKLINKDLSLSASASSSRGEALVQRSKQVHDEVANEDAILKPSTYDKDAHTIVVNSLDDDDDDESEQVRFVLNLPGPIDKTFSKHFAPNVEMGRSHPSNSQLVLYEGRPEEIVARNLDRSREGLDLDAEAMDLD